MTFSRFKIILLIAFGLFSLPAFSQKTLTGKISKPAGDPLPNVIVMLQSDDGKKTFAYALSESSGFYKIKIEGEDKGKRLVFRILGYDEEIVKLEDAGNPLNVVLIETNNILQEVVITPQSIRISGDTTEYNMASFSDGTERTLEEVLKKMPGIEVEENGDILFKGNSIKKIKLDDADLFDRDYKLASRNLPPGIISKVQAIEHYHENKLLKNAEHSDDVILNLKFKDGLNLSRPFGQTNDAGGYENRYSLDAKVFSVNKKIKLFDIASLGNSLYSRPFSAEEHRYSLYEDFHDYANAEVAGTYFNREYEGEIKRAENRQAFNSLNFVYQPVKKLQVTGNLLFDNTKESVMDNTKTLYFTDSLLINDLSIIRGEHKTAYGLLKMKYDIADDMAVEYSAYYNNYRKPFVNEMFNTESVAYNTDDKNRIFINNIELTKALKDSSAVVFKASAINNRASQIFDYSLIENNEQKIFQTVQASTGQYSASVKYYEKSRKNFYYTIGTRISRNEQEMDSEMQHDDESSASDLSLIDNAFIINGKITYQKGKSIFGLQSDFGYRQQILKRIDKETVNDKRPEFLPRFDYGLTLGKHNFKVSGTYAQGRFSARDYIDYFTDYRARKKGADVSVYGSDVSSSLSYSYADFQTINSLFILLKYIYTKNNNVFSDKTDITPSMNYSTSILGKNRNSHQFFAQLNKYIDEIRHGIKFEGGIFSNEYYNAVNSDELNKNKSFLASSKISIKSVLDIPFDYNIGFSFSYSSFQSAYISANNMFKYSLFQETLFRPSKNICVKLKFNEYFLGKNREFYLFVHPELLYSFKKYRLTTGIYAYNITNTDHITDYQIGDYYSIEQYSSIVPMQCLVYVQLQF